jgi:hypothetical protein
LKGLERGEREGGERGERKRERWSVSKNRVETGAVKREEIFDEFSSGFSPVIPPLTLIGKYLG